MLVTSVRKLKWKCPTAVHTATAFCDRIEVRPLWGHQFGLRTQHTFPAGRSWYWPGLRTAGEDIQREMTRMITYSRLWLLLKRRGYSPRDIIRLAGISESTYRKMSRNEPVRMDVLERICLSLHVDIGDVCSIEL